VGAGIPALGQEGYDFPGGRCSVKCLASVYCGGTGLLVVPEEQQVIAFLPSVRNLVSLFFDGGSGTFLLSGIVVSAGLPCSLGREASWHPQSSKA
jgi:hypothetical protein